jgi:tetratricopeptide (TPR) repeat protein
MGLDEVGTARTLREHLTVTDALVAKHGGRLVKTTGDGVLLEFPSVVDAVECAVAVQEVMTQRNDGVPVDRRMLFRIGINLGDILIEGDDILGDGVNIAARLEGIAEPGGICLSASTYDQVRGKVVVEFADLGEQLLKNIARPIRAYAVGPRANAHQTAPLPYSAPHLSIVVLPFANIGGDHEQEYFVDGVTESLTTDLSRIIGAFDRALRLGLMHIFSNRAALGITECERALALDQNSARAHGAVGIAKFFLGRGGETQAHIEQALRLSPRDTYVYIWTMFVGLAKFWLGADAEAIVWLRRSLEANRNIPNTHFYLAAVLAHVGELDEARALAQAGLALNPSFSIGRYRTNNSSDHPVYLAGRERVYEGMRMAGVPEG